MRNYPTLYREGLRAAYAYADAHGMVAYEDWDTEDCPYHNPDGSLKTNPPARPDGPIMRFMADEKLAGAGSDAAS